MPSPLFYLFVLIMLAGGICVVSMKNPVSSAVGMIVSFIGIAGLLIGLNAYFIGTLQVLVYAGAVMVLFLFIIMLLDLKKDVGAKKSPSTIAAGVIIPLLFVLITIPVMQSVKGDFQKIDGKTLVAASEKLDDSVAKDSKIRAALRGEKDFTKPANAKKATLPDVNLIGHTLFNHYNFPLQIVAVLLLVATVGCVTLSKKLHGDAVTVEPDTRMAKTLPKSTDIPQVPGALQAVAMPEPESQPEPVVENTEPEAEGTIIHEKRGRIYTSAPTLVDDLKVISGVGPVLEKKLNDFGVYTYLQISEWTVSNIAEFDELLTFKGRIERDNWVQQAKELHDKKYA